MRWGDGRRADSDFAREQILDAAWRCYQKKSIYKTSMEHIAREAKISRTTVYRYFQNRDEVMAGVMVRALTELSRDISAQLTDIPSFAEFLVESLTRVSEATMSSPVFSLLLQEEMSMRSRVFVGSADIIGLVASFFRPRFEQARQTGELVDGVEFEQFIDWIIHMLAAYALAPSSPLRGSDGWRHMLWRFLVPAIAKESSYTRR